MIAVITSSLGFGGFFVTAPIIRATATGLLGVVMRRSHVFDSSSISAILISADYVSGRSTRGALPLRSYESQLSVINKFEDCDRGNKHWDTIQAKTSVNPRIQRTAPDRRHSIQFDSCCSVHS